MFVFKWKATYVSKMIMLKSVKIRMITCAAWRCPRLRVWYHTKPWGGVIIFGEGIVHFHICKVAWLYGHYNRQVQNMRFKKALFIVVNADKNRSYEGELTYTFFVVLITVVHESNNMGIASIGYFSLTRSRGFTAKNNTISDGSVA